MATSNTTTFSISTTECIELALTLINVHGEGDYLNAFDTKTAKTMLNLMIKNWQADDIHLWVKQTVVVFPQKEQSKYTLNSSTTDHATASYSSTTLTGDTATGIDTLTVGSTADMTAGDYIGVVQDDNTLFWSTVDTVVSSTSVKMLSALTDDASDGANIYTYTTKLDQPFNVYSATRHSTDAIDVPLNYMSYQEYFDQPNKEQESIPVSYSYDRQRDAAVIRLWPTPANVDSLIKLTIMTKIQDVEIGADEFDFPQEWLLPIAQNLAVLMGPIYGKTGSQSFAELKSQARESFIRANAYDNEPGSLYLMPSTQNFREA